MTDGCRFLCTLVVVVSFFHAGKFSFTVRVVRCWIILIKFQLSHERYSAFRGFVALEDMIYWLDFLVHFIFIFLRDELHIELVFINRINPENFFG